MKRHSTTRSLIIGALVAFSVQKAVAGTFANGSFELPGGLPADSFVILADGDTTLTGWTISGPNTNSGIAWHNGIKLPELDFLPVDGAYHIVFNGGNRPAGDLIAQTFDTTPGVDYEVTFHVGQLGSGAGQVSLTASVTSSTGQQLASLVATPPAHGYGSRQQLVFGATTERTTLFFTDTSSATVSVDVALDNVAVSPLAPEATIRVSQVEVWWGSLSDRTYQIQYRSDLTTNMWTNLGAPIQGTGSPICVYDSVSSEPRRFYRIVKLP
jgi:hypothetical protein